MNLQEQISQREKARKRAKSLSFDSIATHGVYDLNEALLNQGSIIEPIYLSTAQTFENAEIMQKALAYEIPSWSYTRIHNPTLYYLEETLALLESYECSSEAHACVTSSGMSAINTVVEALLEGAENANFVSSAQVYGGTFQLFSICQAQKKRQVRWVDATANIEKWEENIDENTRFIYIEVPSNPTIAMSDIKALSVLAHQYNIPLIVDATLATPALIRPLQYGADIVIHSLSKIMNASGMVIGGALIAKENISAGFLADEIRENFAGFIKLLLNRDNGACLSPMQAFLTLSELRTLRMRVEKFSHNALKIAQFLEAHPKVDWVSYPGLESYQQKDLAREYFWLVDSQTESYNYKAVHAFGHLMSFSVKGDGQTANEVLTRLKLIFRATDLGRVKSIATIPATTTHQQQGDQGREIAGIENNLIRLSIGGESPIDLMEDLDQALAG